MIERRTLLKLALLSPLAPLFKVGGAVSRCLPRQECVWTGAVSSDWSNPLNWLNGVVPKAYDNVRIGPSKFGAYMDDPCPPIDTLTLDGGSVGYIESNVKACILSSGKIMPSMPQYRTTILEQNEPCFVELSSNTIPVVKQS